MWITYNFLLKKLGNKENKMIRMSDKSYCIKIEICYTI